MTTSTAAAHFAGANSLKVQIPEPFSDQSEISFHFDEGIDPAEYGALTFAIGSNHLNMDAYLYVVDSNGTELPGVSVTSYLANRALSEDWQVVWVPLRDLIGSTGTIASFHLKFSQGGTVWLDEVNVVEELVWPLPEFPAGNHTTGYLFGENWLETGDLHGGVDYSTCATANKTVVAAHAGKVVDLHEDSDPLWGWHVIIQSASDVFATKYTHVTPTIELNSYVEAGDPIGVTGDIPSPHLHFAIRMGLYDINTDAAIMYAGALSPSTFPEAFIDPSLAWPTHTIIADDCIPLAP